MLTIDKEFKELIPPLTQKEYAELEESIVTEGCRDPLVVWDDIIVDGHNRYAICTEHNIPYKTVNRDFSDRDEVIIWMAKNQFGRRNLSAYRRCKLALRLKPIIANKAKERKLAGKADLSLNSDEGGRTDDAIGKIAGVGRDTIRKVEVIEIQASNEIKEQLDNGEISIDDAYRTVTGKQKPHVTNNSGNNEWYTPEEYIELARNVMGTIDLDPASCEYANRTVKAKQYYDIETDGLTHEWTGKVWMNPPYSSELISKFTEKFTEEYSNGNITEGIVLVNNATDTDWFNKLAAQAEAIVFTNKRIKFNSDTKTSNSPLQGQAFLYFGEWKQNFLREFKNVGLRCKVVRPNE